MDGKFYRSFILNFLKLFKANHFFRSDFDAPPTTIIDTVLSYIYKNICKTSAGKDYKNGRDLLCILRSETKGLFCNGAQTTE